ncbi:MAG: T9SS type A sorting domain-containing protein [Saprospiraceae bacterium]|nr:T9SS type A sorting domain-containing protein [Saprospiraceae bacterium]
MKVIINDGNNIIHSKTLSVTNDIASGQYFYFTYDLNLELGVYDVVIECDIDSNNENNGVVLSFEGQTGVIEAPVKYTFDDQSFQETFNISNDLLDFNKFQSEYYMTSVGNSYEEVPCFDVSSNFELFSYSYTTSSAKTCLDLTNFSAPQLAFDLRQYRSAFLSKFDKDSLSATSSVMRVNYNNGTEEFTDYIYGQQEGKKVAHKYNLPKGFKGEINLSFYNNNGDSEFSIARLPKIDAMLLDNLIFDNASATKDQLEEHIKIFPNPATDVITFESNISSPVSLTILNSQGLVILQMKEVQHNTKISASAFAQGYYLLKFVTDDGSQIVKPFIKM